MARPDRTTGAEADDAAAARAWFDAAAREEVSREIVAIYDGITAEIERRRPRCVASGRCCHFERFGHRLYVTGLETAWCLRRTGRELQRGAIDAAREAGTCPFLVEGRCAVHLVKPIGCRVFFCDPEAEAWQEALSERSLGAIREVHARFDLPYRYGEWRSMLAWCLPARPEASERSGVVEDRVTEAGRFVPLRVRPGDSR